MGTSQIVESMTPFRFDKVPKCFTDLGIIKIQIFLNHILQEYFIKWLLDVQ